MEDTLRGSSNHLAEIAEDEPEKTVKKPDSVRVCRPEERREVSDLKCTVE